METLKEIRTRLGLNQTEVAKKIGATVPQISLYENGVGNPCLEDMCLLQREFGTVLQWNDPHGQDKEQFKQAINVLLDYFPVQSVLTFCQQALKQKIGRPTKLVVHFANVAMGTDHIEPPLLSPGINQNT